MESSCCILAIDLTGTQSRRDRYCMDRKCSHQFVEELQPFRFSLRRIGAGYPVRQLDQGNDRDCDFLTGSAHTDFGKSLTRISAHAFCRDEHAGVEYQPHWINPMPED